MSTRKIAKSLFYGQLCGLAYFISTLIFFWPNEELFFIRNAFSKMHFFLYSISFWIIVFALLTAVLFVICGLIERNKQGFITEFLSISVVCFVVLAGYGIYFYYDFSTPPHYPTYLLKAELIRVVSIIFGISVVTGIAGHLILKKWRKIVKFPKNLGSLLPKLYTSSCVTCSFFLVYFLGSTLVSHFSNAKRKGDSGTTVRNVFVLGLDAASWNILVPLLKSGVLPNMAKMIGESSCAYLDTYGEQFTPTVWASIATGMKHEKHSIDGFESSIYDWRAKPLWEILSDEGAKVGVVNWMNAYPAVDLNGFMLSDNQGKLPYRFSVNNPEDFNVPPEKIFLPVDMEKDADRLDGMMKKLRSELENLGRVIQYCGNLPSYRAILTYVYTIDGIQHFFWSNFRSGERQIFSSAWKDIDGLIGDVYQRINEDTYFCIMSDHGSRFVNKPEIVLNLERILEILDYLPPHEKDSAEALISVVDEERIAVSKEMSNSMVSHLVTELRNVKFSKSNEPVFRAVEISGSEANRLISLKLTRPLKVRPKNPSQIKIKGRDYSYDDITYPQSWSGRHCARGMIAVRGPGVKRQFLGAWVVDSPYAFIYRQLHGKTKGMDRIFPLLRFFHLVDPITTIDITPTVLTLLGYPTAKDMDGRDVSSLIATGTLQKALSPIKSYGPSRYYDKSKKMSEEAKKKIIEEMRALGYVK